MNLSLFFSAINIIRDSIFAFLYMNCLEKKKNSHKILSILSLSLCLAMIRGSQPGTFFSNSLTRLFFRWICYFGFLYSSKKLSVKTALYHALLTDVLCIIVHNVFLTPALRPILLGEKIFVMNSFLNQFICNSIVQIFCIILYALIYKYLPLKSIHSINPSRIALLIVMTVSSLYINNSLRFITDNSTSQPADFSVYSIILQFSMIMCIIFMEKMQISMEDKIAAEIKMIHANTMLENLKLQEESDEKIRRIRHDLKNHIIAIKYLASQENSEQVIDYIDNLSSEFNDHPIHTETGHSLLNSLFSQKIAKAETENIFISISADFSVLKHINDVDLCIIFGNILDNAIEACQKVDDDRYIDIRSNCIGNNFILKTENNFIGDFSQDDNKIISTKRNRENHGLGIKNIINTTKKYDGIFTFDANNETGKFTSTLLIPLNNPTTESAQH